MSENGINNLGDLKPFQLVSLYSMLIHFAAHDLAEAANLLSLLTVQIGITSVKNGSDSLVADNKDIVKSTLNRMEELLPLVSQCGLKGTVGRVKGITELCRTAKAEGPHGPTLPVLTDRLIGLHHQMCQELSERVYLYLPSAECYEHKELFGADVALRFPQANTEITFAGNCYATGNYTACVFHLTRAVEIAARVLVSALGVGNELKNFKSVIVPAKLATWDQLTSALQKGVDRKQANISTNSIRRETYEFYNHAVSQFRNFKDAWRNKTSHKRVTYGEGQAKDIMDNVRQFMQHVSQRLKEPKGATFE